MKLIGLLLFVTTVVYGFPPLLGGFQPICLIKCADCNMRCPEKYRPTFCDCSCPPKCECPEMLKCKGEKAVDCPEVSCNGTLIMEPCGCRCPRCEDMKGIMKG